MILVLEGEGKSEHRGILEELYRQRYRHFVVRRNWSLPVKGERDIDQYDASDAAYFVYIDDDGTIAGSARVNQTATSSLLGDLFPFLIETGEEPRGPTIFEGSRFIVDPAARSSTTSRRIKAEILSAIVEYCLERGGTEFQAVIEANMLATFVELTMRTRVLGLAHDYGGGVRASGGGRCMAFRWALSNALLSDLRAHAIPVEDETGRPHAAAH